MVGRLPRLFVLRPARCSRVLGPVSSRVAFTATFASKAPTASLPPLPFRLLPAGTTSCRTGLSPAEDQRLFTAHIHLPKNKGRAAGSRCQDAATLGEPFRATTPHDTRTA